MYVEIGDRILITGDAYWPNKQIIGQYGIVTGLRLDFVPSSAIVRFQDGKEAWIYIKNLEVLPPESCFFQRGDLVKIIKIYTGLKHHYCKAEMLYQIGKIKAYDSRDGSFLVDCDYVTGWFPLYCLIPVNFKGETFYYPNDVVFYQERACTIQEIARTKFNNGQLLKIDGEWVPSSAVSRG